MQKTGYRKKGKCAGVSKPFLQVVLPSTADIRARKISHFEGFYARYLRFAGKAGKVSLFCICITIPITISL